MDIASLGTLIEELSVEEVQEALQEFRCSKNLDLQGFLRNEAISRDLIHLSKTFLCFEELNQRKELVAYFSLAVKPFKIKGTSDEIKEKLTYGNIISPHYIPVYLIGQLGKDDRVTRKIGDELLKKVFSVIIGVRENVGGTGVLVECEPPLRNYYELHGFTYVKTDRGLDQLIQFI